VHDFDSYDRRERLDGQNI